MDIDKKKKSKLNQEIDALIVKNGGSITREKIVEEAMRDGTELHKTAEKQGLFDKNKVQKFALMTWAGMVIRQYHVWISVEAKEPVKVRALVSLSKDRGHHGYRPLIAVMGDDEKRVELMETAKNELAAFRKKYATLSELAPIFEAIDKI